MPKFASVDPLVTVNVYVFAVLSLIKALKQNPSVFYSFVRDYRSIISTNPGYAPLAEGELDYESGKLDEALPKLIAAVDEAFNAKCPVGEIPIGPLLKYVNQEALPFQDYI